jgi:myo-inositol-1(or 4)-monophosphatase
MSDEFAGRFACAQRLADEAGRVILPYFRKALTVDDKGGPGLYDPVTDADREAEKAIRALIREDFPDDGILGEELGDVAGTSGFRWVIDPIDGTRAFIAGQPLWGTLIALEQNGVPVLGVLDQPFLRERFTGRKTRTEFANAEGVRPLRTRPCARLADALICTTHPIAHFNEEKRARFFAVERGARLSRYGGDCYAYGLLAMGFIDIVIESGLKRWDVAAAIPIIEGAGGIVTDWTGGPAHDGGDVIASGDARLHAEALRLLNP